MRRPQTSPAEFPPPPTVIPIKTSATRSKIDKIGEQDKLYQLTMKSHSSLRDNTRQQENQIEINARINEIKFRINHQREKRQQFGSSLLLDSCDAVKQQQIRDARRIRNLEERLNKARIRKDVNEAANLDAMRKIDGRRGHRLSLERKYKLVLSPFFFPDLH